MEQRRAARAQGQPGRWLWLLVAMLLLPGAARAACAGPPLRLEMLAPRLWWLPAASAGDAEGSNRGHVSHLLLADDGTRLWLVGSGPTPAFGRALACQVRERFGRPLTDVISPWPRPELVLGLAGLGPVRSWAHADVARAMRARCGACVQRLRARLKDTNADAAGDLGAQPVRVPQHRLHGRSGRLGPWHWWRLERGPGFPVTVWQLHGTDLRFAPGLLWGSGVPDGRDAHIATLAANLATLSNIPPPAGAADVPRWLGEQGPLLPAPAAAVQARYISALLAAVRQEQSRGDADTGTPPPIEGIDAATAGDPRHALNWQRAWRQLEDAAPPSPGPQRSLR